MNHEFRRLRYRLYPTKKQERVLTQHLALCCELYNAALQERRDAWASHGKSISLYDQQNQLPDLKKERQDLAGVYSQVSQNVLRRLNSSFQAFFARVKRGEKAGYPRFKSVRHYDSLTYPQDGFKVDGKRLIMAKVGRVKIELHRPIEGKVKTLTVKREAGKWYAIFVVEQLPRILPESCESIGIDLGLAQFAVFSDGTEIPNPAFDKAANASLRVVSRKVSRRVCGSKRWRKAVRLLQKQHTYTKNQRSDFHHKLSRQLVDKYGIVVVEDLNIVGMSAGIFSRQIRDVGWGGFLGDLAYKAESAGRRIVKIDPRGTSQTCVCGASVPKNLKDRWHECRSCGLSVSRDHASAVVILQRGLGLSLQASTCGLSTSALPEKSQE